jgi:hypothetical protein
VEVSGQLCSSAALLLEKDPPAPIDRSMGGPQNQGRLGHKEKNHIFVRDLTLVLKPTDFSVIFRIRFRHFLLWRIVNAQVHWQLCTKSVQNELIHNIEITLQT